MKKAFLSFLKRRNDLRLEKFLVRFIDHRIAKPHKRSSELVDCALAIIEEVCCEQEN
ncbi:MAG: hypothetical protein JZU50_03730 [Desulfobulbaceae bacterium]|nr:hypothetical protein [Desulfobulbaceae bacterium]